MNFGPFAKQSQLSLYMIMNTDERFGYVHAWIEIPARCLVHVNDLLQTASSLELFPKERGRELLTISTGKTSWLVPWLVHSTAPDMAKGVPPSQLLCGASASDSGCQHLGPGYDWLMGCFWLNWGDSRLSFFTMVNVWIWVDQLETWNRTHLPPCLFVLYCHINVPGNLIKPCSHENWFGIDWCVL